MVTKGYTLQEYLNSEKCNLKFRFPRKITAPRGITCGHCPLKVQSALRMCYTLRVHSKDLHKVYNGNSLSMHFGFVLFPFLVVLLKCYSILTFAYICTCIHYRLGYDFGEHAFFHSEIGLPQLILYILRLSLFS